MSVFNSSYFFGMSSYTLQKFLVEKYGSSALKCRVGRLHTMLSNYFMFKSRIYMKKNQNLGWSLFSGYPARLSTSYISVGMWIITSTWKEQKRITNGKQRHFGVWQIYPPPGDKGGFWGKKRWKKNWKSYMQGWFWKKNKKLKILHEVISINHFQKVPFFTDI